MMTTEKITQSPVPTTLPAFSETCWTCHVPIASESGQTIEGQEYCPECSQQFREALRIEKQQRSEQRLYGLRDRGLVDETFADVSFNLSRSEVENLNSDAWRRARNWKGENVFVSGPVGVGKTFLSRCVLARAFYAERGDVGIVSARRFAKVSDRFDEGGHMMKRWQTVPFLLLDDLDKAEWTPERLGALWELLDRRMTRKMVTLVTSNCPSRELRDLLRTACPNNQSLADAALDRLKPCLNLELKGRSLR